MVTFSICETAKRKKDINKAIDIYLSAIDIETSYEKAEASYAED